MIRLSSNSGIIINIPYRDLEHARDMVKLFNRAAEGWFAEIIDEFS